MYEMVLMKVSYIESEVYREQSWESFLHKEIILMVPQGGVSPKKVEFQTSLNNMFWVV